MEKVSSFWWLWPPAFLGFFAGPILQRIFVRKAFLTLEEEHGKARLVLENTAGEKLQRLKVKVVLPEGLSVSEIRDVSEGEVKFENGSLAWTLDELGRNDRKVLEFDISSPTVSENGRIEFLSEPSADESYHYDRQGLHWKIYSPQTRKVRTLLYRMSANDAASSEFAWKIQV